MWQIFSFFSVLAGTIEETVDKATMVGSRAVDIVGASWLRNSALLIVTFFGGWLIESQVPVFVWSAPILILGILYAIQALFYTGMLRHVEITTSSLLDSLIPLVFLPIDIFFIGAPFLPRQVIGVIALVVGGVIFFWKRGNITRAHVRLMLMAFTFDLVIYGLESYSFQSLFESGSVSVVDFLWSMWSVMVIVLTIMFAAVCLYQRTVPKVSHYTRYLRGSFIAKTADYTGSFFYLQALTLASVSQVAAMKSIYPLVLIGVAAVAQKHLKINLDETLGRKTFLQKVIASAVVCVGIYLIR